LQRVAGADIFTSVDEKKVPLQEILSGFEFVPGHGAWPRTVLILTEFKFMVPEL